jgi:hypothetical protein
MNAKKMSNQMLRVKAVMQHEKKEKKSGGMKAKAVKGAY